GATSRKPWATYIRCEAAGRGDRNGGEPLGYMVENRRLRSALAELVNAQGLEVRAPAAVADVAVGPGRATVTLKDGSTLSAPLVIGAEGRNSTVRRAAGIDVFGWTYQNVGFVCT